MFFVDIPNPGDYAMIKKLMLVCLLVAMTGWLAACETMEGVGQDTQKAGRNIEKAADQNK